VTISVRARWGALALAAMLVAGACTSSATTAPAASGAPAPSTAASMAPSTAASMAPSAASSMAPAASGSVSCVNGSITAVGSTALQPLVDAAGKAYTQACPGATINVQGGGSGTGLTQVSGGGADIGDSDVTAESKLPAAQASQLVDHVVAKQGWIMVDNPDVTGVTNLTTAQAKSIWTGQITNWNQVGGPNLPIVLILRPESSGTRATFKKIVLGGANEAAGQALTEDSNGAVTQAVEKTPGSTSVIGFAYYQQNKSALAGLSLDGVQATVANMADGSYKLSADGHMYTKGQPSGLAASFLQFMLGTQVQKTIIPSLFYAPVVQ